IGPTRVVRWSGDRAGAPARRPIPVDRPRRPAALPRLRRSGRRPAGGRRTRSGRFGGELVGRRPAADAPVPCTRVGPGRARAGPVASAVYTGCWVGGPWALVCRRYRHTPMTLSTTTLALRSSSPARTPTVVLAEHVEVTLRRSDFFSISDDFLATAPSVTATSAYMRGLPYRRGTQTIQAP